MKKQQYKLIKSEGDVIDYILEKSNLTSEFTIREIKQNLKAMGKLKTEFEAKLQIEKAAIENIEHYHPYVKDMTPEQLNAVSMYHTSKEYVAQVVPKLAEIAAVVAADQKTLDEVKEALNLSVDEENSKSAS